LHLVGILFPHKNDDARSKSLQIICILFATLRYITQTLSIKQSPGQDVPTSSGESSGGSGA